MLETVGSSNNGRTQVLLAVEGPERDVEEHRAAFLRAWPRLRPALRAFGKTGFVLAAQRFALGGGEQEGAFCLELPLEPDRSAHRVVGRHTRADLVLRGDDSVSLRHLLVSAWLEEGRPTFRVLDTGTEGRFETEDGTNVAAMRADGTCFLRVGTWNLMAIWTSPDLDWPEDPQAAWDQLPPREAVEARTSWLRPPLKARAYPRLKVVREDVGGLSSTQILRLAELPPESRAAVGALFLPDRRSVRLSVQALTRGVLIGRYERCGVDSELLCADESIYRIHLCLVQDPTGLWAVDMASTNGSRLEGRTFRALRLGRDADLCLSRATRLRWEMA